MIQEGCNPNAKPAYKSWQGMEAGLLLAAGPCLLDQLRSEEISLLSFSPIHPPSMLQIRSGKALEKISVLVRIDEYLLSRCFFERLNIKEATMQTYPVVRWRKLVLISFFVALMSLVFIFGIGTPAEARPVAAQTPFPMTQFGINSINPPINSISPATGFDASFNAQNMANASNIGARVGSLACRVVLGRAALA